MEEFDLKAIWQNSEDHSAGLPSVVASAEKRRGDSLNLVERIKKTARQEHRSFLAAAALGSVLLVVFQYYWWALGLMVFAGLMIWKYETEMRLFNRIKPESSTVEYLKSVKYLLEKFMHNYRIGILIFIPIVALGGGLLGQYWVSGSIDLTFWLQAGTWAYFAVSIVVAIFFSRLWLKLWVHTFYGKKLQEMNIIIDELEAL